MTGRRLRDTASWAASAGSGRLSGFAIDSPRRMRARSSRGPGRRRRCPRRCGDFRAMSPRRASRRSIISSRWTPTSRRSCTRCSARTRSTRIASRSRSSSRWSWRTPASAARGSAHSPRRTSNTGLLIDAVGALRDPRALHEQLNAVDSGVGSTEGQIASGDMARNSRWIA